MDKSGVSVTTAMEAGTSMLSRMEDEKARRFNPSDVPVLLYQHAQDRMCVDITT